MQTPTLSIDIDLPLNKFHLKLKCDFHSKIIGVFGPSGSGKTSLLESIAGLRRKTTGKISCGDSTWLDSATKTFIHTENRRIGYVPQDHLLFPHLNVTQNLRFGSNPSTTHDPTCIKLQEVVKILQLQPLLDRKPAELSGGEKQRVALGRALYSNPQLLILDEPMASLDAELRRRILPYLLKIKTHFKIPILIVSHNPLELQALCDEVIALKHGQLVGRGTPIKVFTSPDIYPSHDKGSFQNMLPARVFSHNTHTSLTHLGKKGNGQAILVLKCDDKDSGNPIILGFPANDILIAAEQTPRISARNQLFARIETIQTIEHKQVITTRLLDGTQLPIVVELTLTSVEELHLSVGSEIYLIFKSSSVEVF